MLVYCISLLHCPLLINFSYGYLQDDQQLFDAYLPLFTVSPIYRYVLWMKYVRIRCELFLSLFLFLIDFATAFYRILINSKDHTAHCHIMYF